jgi:hypothetical protein
MRNVAATMALLVTLTVPETCLGQNYADAIGNVPASVRALKFGTSFADVQKALPDARAIGTSSDPRSVLGVYFKPPEVWDVAILDFIRGRLEAISLGIIYNTPDVLPRSVALLDRVIDRNGPTYERSITLNTSKQPVPTRVWMKDDFQLFAIGPSAGVSVAGSEIFRVDPQLQVGVARKSRPLADIKDVAGPNQLRDLLFKAVSPTAK